MDPRCRDPARELYFLAYSPTMIRSTNPSIMPVKQAFSIGQTSMRKKRKDYNGARKYESNERSAQYNIFTLPA
jgi:hypothetical protein